MCYLEAFDQYMDYYFYFGFEDNEPTRLTFNPSNDLADQLIGFLTKKKNDKMYYEINILI